MGVRRAEMPSHGAAQPGPQDSLSDEIKWPPAPVCGASDCVGQPVSRVPRPVSDVLCPMFPWAYSLCYDEVAHAMASASGDPRTQSNPVD